eukprot:TRINITY_DN696_c0_g1_i2.p1 TRINITY_DN696_c0_g1~~TRINITY_DN696_c0_g1_i2.p1  ORF type:complete len:299 (+),score=76.35 TRINITY_DN696_c0_g1_i2:80-976(+)
MSSTPFVDPSKKGPSTSVFSPTDKLQSPCTKMLMQRATERRKQTIVLGSTSKWRRQMFETVFPQFQSVAPEIDEKAIRDEDPKNLVLKISNAKADAVVSKVDRNSIVVCGDQVIAFQNKILEKPESPEEAVEFMRSYNNAKESPCTVSGMVVVNTATGKRVSGVDICTVHYSNMPEENIISAAQTEDIQSCCGAVCVEHELVKDFVKIEGTMDSVFGLPKELLLKLVADVGGTLPRSSGLSGLSLNIKPQVGKRGVPGAGTRRMRPFQLKAMTIPAESDSEPEEDNDDELADLEVLNE